MLARGEPGPSYDRQLHQPRLWPGLLARRGSGLTRGSHSCRGLEAARCWPLKLDEHAGGQEHVGLDLRPGSGRVHLPNVGAGVVRTGLAVDLSLLISVAA